MCSSRTAAYQQTLLPVRAALSQRWTLSVRSRSLGLGRGPEGRCARAWESCCGDRASAMFTCAPSCSIASHPLFVFFFFARRAWSLSPSGKLPQGTHGFIVLVAPSPPPALHPSSAVWCGEGLVAQLIGAPVIRWTEGTGVLLCSILLRGHGGVHTGWASDVWGALFDGLYVDVMMSLSALRGTRHPRNSIQTTLGLSWIFWSFYSSRVVILSACFSIRALNETTVPVICNQLCSLWLRSNLYQCLIW